MDYFPFEELPCEIRLEVFDKTDGLDLFLFSMTSSSYAHLKPDVLDIIMGSCCYDKYLKVAISNGYVSMAKGFVNFFRMSDIMMSDAILGCHLEMVKYLEKIGCPSDSLRCLESAAKNGGIDLFTYVWDRHSWYIKGISEYEGTFGPGIVYRERLYSLIGSEGHLSILAFLEENDEDFEVMTRTVATAAASAEQISVLDWINSRGYKDSLKGVEMTAAKYGQIKSLRYLIENGCEMTERLFSKAIYGGYIEVLEFLISKGCPASPQVYTEAERNGGEILRLLGKGK